MRRRRVLEGVAAAGLCSLAGCTSPLGGNGTVLGRIEVINASFVSNRIRLLVTRDEETVLDRPVELPAMGGGDGLPMTVVPPTWPEVRGAYTVHATHYGDDGDRESRTWEHTFTRDDYDDYYPDDRDDPGCLAAVVKMGSLAESANAPIGIGPTYADDPCEPTSTESQ
ncbi:hypothetical protein [Halobaculum limi]|uniref:hypothetical protein n=1 Tax=Halobaculum limi TaxID=3031916 RepID=UPI00240663A0|nr:hypothetical protein [Halobaculum sp. YSMS11]